MNLFFDTSALLKRYIYETGSEEVEKLCNHAQVIAISIVLPIEVTSTLKRLNREKKISAKQLGIIKSEFLSDIRDMAVITIDPLVVRYSIDVIERVPVKALDATHIGCALAYAPDHFVSGDKQQLSAAKKMGLNVISLI